MPISKAQICNLALAHIKQTKTTISNLETDQGNTATQCRIHYDLARQFVLTDHSWNFATKRVALTDLGTPTTDWAYMYDYPSDCLKMREIIRASKTDDPIPFAVEDDGTGEGLSVLTDQGAAVGLYTWDVTNTGLFMPAFISAFSWYLASEIAPALSGSEKIQEAALTVYRNTVASAQSTDSSEGQSDAEALSPWEQAKLGLDA